MPRIQVAPSCVVEEQYSLPSIVLENWYAELVAGNFGWDFRLVPTSGLVGFSTDGAKGRGAFQSDAIASGPIFVVYGTAVKRINASATETAIAGAVIDDDKPIAFALSQTQAVINSGGMVYTATAANITDFTANLTAAGASGAMIDVAVSNNRHLYVEDDSARVFYSAPGAATTIDGFFTAERDPDKMTGILVVGADILALGKRKTEVWAGTDSSTIPFIQRQGMVFEYGVIGNRARCQIGGAGYWAAHDNTIRRYQGGLVAEISEDWLTRQIASLTNANKALVRLTAHNWRGHQFVKVYVPTKGSYFFNAKIGTWHRRRDLGDELMADWGFDYFVEAFGFTYCLKLSTGKLFKLDPATYTENAVSVRRVATFIAPITAQTAIKNFIIEGQSGVGLDASGVDENDNPKCMLRASYDGHTFGDELQAEFGRHAQYPWRPVFGSLGTFRPPVGKIELAYSAAVGWTVYGATHGERP